MSTLADRLLAASGRLFVGREAQCNLFASALKARELPFSIVQVYGPGGVGKTSLLYEFRRICRALDVPAFYLDARTISANSIAFTDALRMLTGADESPFLGSDPLETPQRKVLFIDTYELLASLEQWLYNSFFAGISDQVLIVLAGRNEPSAIWMNDPGWQSLIQKMPLRNLSPAESVHYLERAGMPPDYHESVLSFTRGHPLALSLVADLYVQRPERFRDFGVDQDVIKMLLDRFVLDVPTERHRRAVEACALVHYLTEPLLGEMVKHTEVHDLFEWLRSLSFIESGPRGLFPHDLARDVLASDLRWRNPEQYKQFHQQARVYYNTKLKNTSPEEQRNILADYIYLHRDNPVVRPFFKRLQSSWKEGAAAVSVHRYLPEDEAAVLEGIARHEGDASAELVKMWLGAQPEHALVYKDASGVVQGFLFQLALHEAEPALLAKDAVALKAWRYVKEHAPLRPGEAATLFRFWLDFDGYHSISRVQSLIFVSMVRHYLTTPNLAYSMLPITKPLFWKIIFNYADLHRVKALNYKVNKKSFGVYTHDWRSRSPSAWLDVLASREVWGTMGQEEPEETRPVVVLSEEMFTSAVRDALRSYTQPLGLKSNPLLDSRVVSEKVEGSAGFDERIQVLIDLLQEGVRRLEHDPKREKAFRAVDRTYIRPAGSQEQVSEMLGMPYSTFRRHLAQGVSEIVAELWQQELGL